MSNCCSFSLMSGHIIHYQCSMKVQLNIFWGPKYGFTASKAFSGKFELIFSLSSICCSFCNCIKIEYQEFLIPFYRSIGYFKPMWSFSWILMVFITLKLIVFLKKKSANFLTLKFLFCSFLSICNQALLWTGE